VEHTDDVKQRKQKHFKHYRTAKQKLTNKENLVRFLHQGKPLISVGRNFVFIGKIVKFWVKRDFTNCAYLSQSLYFIAEVASGVSLVVGLLFFPLFLCRPKKIALNVQVLGQVNSKAIYNDFLSESVILRLNFVVLVK